MRHYNFNDDRQTAKCDVFTELFGGLSSDIQLILKKHRPTGYNDMWQIPFIVPDYAY